MKTAVSIPDKIFRQTDRLASRMKKSRSRIVSEALREYLFRHDSDEITSAMNRVCEEDGGDLDPFTASASRIILKNTDW